MKKPDLIRSDLDFGKVGGSGSKLIDNEKCDLTLGLVNVIDDSSELGESDFGNCDLGKTDLDMAEGDDSINKFDSTIGIEDFRIPFNRWM